VIYSTISAMRSTGEDEEGTVKGENEDLGYLKPREILHECPRSSSGYDDQSIELAPGLG
jgi:hypothetical protein